MTRKPKSNELHPYTAPIAQGDSMPQYRQGDVFLVATAPTFGGTPRPRDGQRHVLAYGEATGHAHAIHDPDCEVVVMESGEVIVRTGAGGATLRHEEHTAINLPAGNYRVVRQREYDGEEERRVED